MKIRSTREERTVEGNFVAYYRVSTEKQDADCAAQRRAVETYLNGGGWESPGWLISPTRSNCRSMRAAAEIYGSGTVARTLIVIRSGRWALNRWKRARRRRTSQSSDDDRRPHVTHHRRGRNFAVLGQNHSFVLAMAARSIVGSFAGGRLLGLVPSPVPLAINLVLLAVKVWRHKDTRSRPFAARARTILGSSRCGGNDHSVAPESA
jgi:hypothetical protein